jgi:signal transduction histidine kinase/DNA-binding response OmpR family regulator/HPt (histidine-containing phosphotransfer) domain-containing protein
MRLFSLRRVLGFSLAAMALVPSMLIGWLLVRSSTQAINELAGAVLSQVAVVVQTGTEDHLRQAHAILNGLIPEKMTEAQEEQARRWLRSPAQFESMAFALARQTPAVSQIHLANLRGEYMGVEHTGRGMRIAYRAASGAGRDFFTARQPGDRSQPLAPEVVNFEPRTRPWYMAALSAKGRVFAPVQVVAGGQQLLVTLAQPAYDPDGGAAGVFAVDLDLKPLADALRTQRISAHGAAFVVDDKGQLVAGSAGDLLLTGPATAAVRRTPQSSANPVIRASFAELERLWAQRGADSVASDTRLRKFDSDGESMLMVQRPFGESLGLRWTLVVAAPLGDFTSNVEQAWKVALWAMVGVLGVAVAIALAIARGIGQPLKRLAKSAEALGKGQIPPLETGTAMEEVRSLSQVLHESGHRLQEYQSRVEADALALKASNDHLEARVEARTRELAASREEALMAARAKAAFLATMSHEIRTPLNGVVGMSTLLAETNLNAEQRDYLETVRISSDQLLAVINDILDFSKIESGKLELESEILALRNVVEEACDIAASRAREKGIELLVDLPDPAEGNLPRAIKGDVTRLRQVLLNLISNAVKFTAKGEVTIAARVLKPADEHSNVLLEFRVSDTGIGIPPDRLPALFDAFTQVDASTTRKYGGTGLGLAICKRLVGLMGGEIGVQSEPGKGSVFWFTVRAPEAQEEVVAPSATAHVLQSRRVLIVDDHAINVRILSRQLQLWGMQVASAESGEQALAALQQAPSGSALSDTLPDLIITDMHMPEMDGITLTRTIKEHPQWRDIPVVLLSSGFLPSGDVSASLFAARLLKPTRQAQLFDTVSRCIAPEPSSTAPSSGILTDVTKNISILVADDNAVNLKVACAMLLKLGYRIRTAVNGREAVEAVAHAMAHGEVFGAVLMDLNMPEVDGLQATRQILSAWGERAPPVIALTAAASADDRERCQVVGMKDYLTKPLQVSLLAHTLERWIPADIAVTASVPVAAPPIGQGDQPPVSPVLAASVDLMDWSRLEEFAEFDDEAQSMTREVVGLFLADVPRRIGAIEEAWAARDAEELGRAAHALKGAASNIGALAVQAECAALEEDAHKGFPPEMKARLDQLHQWLEETRKALDRWT